MTITDDSRACAQNPLASRPGGPPGKPPAFEGQVQFPRRAYQVAVSVLFGLLLAVGAGAGGPLATSTAEAQAPPIEPVAGSPQEAGAEFWVDIKVGSDTSEVSGLFGTSFGLNYDEAHLSVVEDEAGGFLGDDVVYSSNNDASAGEIGIGVTRKSGAGGVGGSGVVARVKFEVAEDVPDGTNLSFSLSEVEADDPEGNEVSLDPQALTVDVEASGAEQPPIVPIADSPQEVGSDFQVGIRVGSEDVPVDSLFGLSFELAYESGSLDVLGDEAGPFFGEDVVYSSNVEAGAGTIGIGITRKAGAGGTSGSGVVARVRMQVRERPFNDSLSFVLRKVTAESPSGSSISLAPESLEVKVGGNAPPETVLSIPDDTLRVPGPPLQLTGLSQAVFDDPDGDSLSLSATSDAPSVAEPLGQSPRAVILKPRAEGTADVTVTASDGDSSATETFTLVVEERPPGAPRPSEQAVAMVGETNADSTATAVFGRTGAAVSLENVDAGGSVKLRFFPGSGPGSGKVAGKARKESPEGVADTFETVSPYEWQVDNRGVSFESASMVFARADTGLTGIGDPKEVHIIQDVSGDGNYEEVLFTFVSNAGTPADSTDDLLVGLEAGEFGTFRLASNDADQNPLPVELAGFDARSSGDEVRLTWQTATERNNAGFEVQRRVEERRLEDSRAEDTGAPGARQKEQEGWTQVGYVESKAEGGTTTETKSYSFAATGLPVGTHQFRLKQVDLDGSSTLIDPVTVDIQMQKALRLTAPAPTPTSTSASLSFAVKEQSETTIRLYNTLGQQVATVHKGTPQAGEEQTAQVDVSGLPSGIYFLRLSADGQTQTQRLTVVR